MKIMAFGVLMMLAAMTGSARADDIQSAYGAVDSLLKKDGGGLVARKALCPQGHDNMVEAAASATVVEINETDRAILVQSAMCSGGNKDGQYLVTIEHGATRVVTDSEIADMSFIASNMYIDGDKLYLYGSRWTKSDPHCCPSKKATLEYDLKTRRHKFNDSK